VNRLRIIAATLSFLLLVAWPSSASAHTSSGEQYARSRSSVSRWEPQLGEFFTSSRSASRMKLTWKFEWFDTNHMPEIDGAHRAFEVKARVSKVLAKGYGSYSANNYPSGARPYKDTLFMDSQNHHNFGFGAGDSNYFHTGARFYSEVDIAKSNEYGGGVVIRSPSTSSQLPMSDTAAARAGATPCASFPTISPMSFARENSRRDSAKALASALGPTS
jgi:hypothetical protein